MAMKHWAVLAISDKRFHFDLTLYNDLLCSSFISSTRNINSRRTGFDYPTRISLSMFMHYHPTLVPSGPAPSRPPLFHAKPKPAFPPRTIHNKPRLNATIKLRTAGSERIICQAPFKRKTKHHKLHNQLKRQPALPTIPEQFEDSVTSAPAISRTSSSSQLLPSFERVTTVLRIFSSLFTKDEEEKEKQQQGRWSWLSWNSSGEESSNNEVIRITTEDLLDVGPAITVTSPKRTPSPSSDPFNQFSNNEPFFPDLGCDKGSHCVLDSDPETHSSTWSGIISRDVFYDETWIAGSQLLRTADGQIVCDLQEKGLLNSVSRKAKKERKKRVKTRVANSDLTVGGTHEYFVKSVHLSSHYTTSVSTTTVSGSFAAGTRTDFLRRARQHAMDMLGLDAMAGSRTE
ncbi:expressed protein [Cryptococcus deneoformans JEC21]|uniref:Expressed protein n=1 Tax=Cryptococcus deneoformans (strain JEC21 / ATCC MYA-565) TaxID=214684 RepID=Q5K781_CRYD1|nr:expressed protein [Cryptococcus neoformans var. neoformans JEC21]AAW47101.1 expressed protein [Cryptococcus neoformans var. neoformans JEC21]